MLASIFPLTLAGFLGLGAAELSMLIALAGLVFGCIIAIVAMYLNHHRQQLWHETARLALEKGQPLPAMPPRDEELAMRPPPGVSFAEWQQAKLIEARTHAFRGGLVLIGVGIGLQLMLGGRSMIGAIPGFIGVALCINALIERFALRHGPKIDPRPPQA